MVTAKERSLQAFNLEKTKGVPVGLFLGGSWPIINSGLTLEELIGYPYKTAQVFWKVNERLDADIVMVGTGATALLIRALGGQVRFDAKGAPQILSPLIRSENDLDNLNMDLVLKDAGLKWLKETAHHLALLAENKRLILASGRAPFTLAAQIYGLENLSKALYKNKDFAHNLLKFTTELSLTYFRIMLEEGLTHGSFIADPIASGDLISKKHFQEFVLPYLKQLVSELGCNKRPTMLHICGDISDRLDLVAETGIDCLSLDMKVDIAKAKQLIGHKVCLAGNVDPVEILEFGKKTDVFQAANNCLEKGGEGFILLPGCDVAANVPEENLKILVESGHQWIN